MPFDEEVAEDPGSWVVQVAARKRQREKQGRFSPHKSQERVNSRAARAMQGHHAPSPRLRGEMPPKGRQRARQRGRVVDAGNRARDKQLPKSEQASKKQKTNTQRRVLKSYQEEGPSACQATRCKSA